MNTSEQSAAFEKLKQLKVGALFMEMGTGKTKVALDLINSRAHRVDYVLWICPCSLKNEIEAERRKWYPDMALDIVGCESIGSSDRIYMETLKKVQDAKCAFLVVDESLKIKNRRAKRTKRILEMGKIAEYKLILNGTPVSRNILDIWAQMEFLSPRILDMYFNQFRNTYCEYYTRGKLRGKIRSHCNIDHLTAKIEPYIFDCDLELNTRKRFYTYEYELNSHYAYEEYKNEILDKYYSIFDDDLNFNAFAMALQKWYCDFEHSDKRDVLTNLIDRIDGSVIVFVRFLSGIPAGAVSITGDDKPQERADKIAAFKRGDFKALYITYGCGAYGLNLQFCHNVIFSEHSWDYAQRVQAEARVYRIGQGEEVNYYDLICEDVGLEGLITDCLEKKSNLLDRVKREIAATKGGAKEWAKTM